MATVTSTLNHGWWVLEFSSFFLFGFTIGPGHLLVQMAPTSTNADKFDDK
jgi:hypothetical protein